MKTVDLEELGLDQGGHLLIDEALRAVPVGGRVEVRGRDPHLRLHVVAWARSRGHQVVGASELAVVKGRSEQDRWRFAERAGGPGVDGVVARPALSWGLAARGALVEAGGPPLTGTDLADKIAVWSDLAPRLYAQAAASQWDPETAVDWADPTVLPAAVEAAVVQVMTYLIENEQAALLVPARFIGRIHPHFREVIALLAVQVADEARHVEVFTRRALLHGGAVGTSGVGGRASLQTLLDEPEFAAASFLLSVLGEGTFLNLLSFLETHAPDPVTRRVSHLVLQDESRQVAFGMSHLQRHLDAEPGLQGRLAAAIERRHDALSQTAGLNADTFDALVVLAAGDWSPASIAKGWSRVQELQAAMADGRRRRLVRLGFSARSSERLAALHTRNFM